MSKSMSKLLLSLVLVLLFSSCDNTSKYKQATRDILKACPEGNYLAVGISLGEYYNNSYNVMCVQKITKAYKKKMLEEL